MSNLAIANANAAAGSTRAPNQGLGLAEQFDAFLILLTTQLKHQDPLSPMDATEFTSQLVQFTGVEQAVNMNKKLEQMLGLMSSDTLGPGTAYLGKEIEALGNQVLLGESGGARFGVTLPQGVGAALVTVLDPNGNPVRVLPAEARPGEQTLQWDGLGIGGARVPAGTYTLRVDAVDPTGRPLQATTSITGTVTGVESRYGTVVLTVGDREVALSDVRSVRLPVAG